MTTVCLRKVEAELHYIEHHLHGATVVIRKTITHVIMPQIKAATVAVPRYIHRDLLALRAEARHAERIAHRALRQAHKAESRFASKPFAAAVAVALGALGLDWLRCKSNPFNKNKNACGLWSDLEGLLGLAIAALAFSDLEELLKAAEAIEGDVIALAKDALNIG